jgi:16S rRNA (adenine1518-N6/adenine1519-N6)-dimethyltransferase
MRKKFGQNFLINPDTRSALLDALELRPGERAWEIGAGLGAMTKGLLERGGRVTAFEIDPAFCRVLREFFARESLGDDPAFTLVEGDVLKTWPTLRVVTRSAATHDEAGELYLLGNLPYNVAAGLLADFIEKGRFFTRMVVTVQREVARRMAAGPGSADYSSFSVLCSSVYKVTTLQVIKGSSFYPAPRVDSQGVRLDLLPAQGAKPKFFYPLVRALFSTRRKIIRNTLSNFAARVIINKDNSKFPFTPQAAASEALKRAGISGTCRAETLGIDEFAALAIVMEDMQSHGT